MLHDAEICWGKVAEDVDVYFETESGIPLVFSREYGNGLCIFLNSGDFKDGEEFCRTAERSNSDAGIRKTGLQFQVRLKKERRHNNGI